MNLLLSFVVPDDLAYHFTVPGHSTLASPWRMRSIMSFRSSYVLSGTLAAKASYDVTLPGMCRRPYSVFLAFPVR